MKHNNSGNAAYIPREDYLGDGGYLGYGGQRDMEGCRKLFILFVLTIVAVVSAIIGGIIALVL